MLSNPEVISLSWCQVFRQVQPSAQGEDGFELTLSIVNAFAEKGDVAKVRQQIRSFLDRYGDQPNAITYAYSALIRAYR